MSAVRRVAHPPTIAGYEFMRLLGQGGFADVFLFQQNSPRRVVAIKVLLAEAAGTDAAARLSAEANAMAGLSQHQNIVTVFHSGVADDGRPYLVMDYYPRPSLAKNWRQAKHSVANVLSIGVQLAGAVESAHRLQPHGILHRDIKPANILGDRSGRPVLGDFGIAMTISDASQAAEGLSVPWSPPEAFAARPWAGPQSDVWGLAATLYSLLAGRAPFEVPGGDNKTHAQADRIRNSPYRPLGRPDAPPSLDQVLATAMAKDPAARYQTMRIFGQALREVENDLGLAPTRLDIIDDDPDWDLDPEEDDDEPGTRLRPITVIDPTGPVPAATAPTQSGSDPGAWPTGPTTTASGSGTFGRSSPSDTGSLAPPPPAGPIPPLATDRRPPRLDDLGPVDHTMLRDAPADSQASPPGAPATWQRFTGAEVEATQHRAPPPTGPVAPVEPAPSAPKRPWAVIVGVAGAVLIGLVIVWLVLTSGQRQPSALPGQGESSGQVEPQDPFGSVAPPAPTELAATIDQGVAHFTWVNPDPQPGDRFHWSVITGTAPGTANLVETPAVDVPIPAGESTVCIEVVTVRASVGSAAARQCA